MIADSKAAVWCFAGYNVQRQTARVEPAFTRNVHEV